MSRKVVLLFFIISITGNLCAQEPGSKIIDDYIIQLLEDFIENSESAEEFDFNTLVEELEYYAQKPINLNEADYDALKELILLSEIQINGILDHIHLFGPLLSVLELQSIPSLDNKTLRLIQPFVSVGTSGETFQMTIPEMIRNGESELFIKHRTVLENQKGYLANDQGITPYEGDPNRLYIRYKHNFQNRLRFGITAEKDAGEAFFKKSNPYGFDFYSMHFHLKDINAKIKDLVIGDYSVSLGQGLILHNNFGASKSAQIMDIKKGGRVLKPYSSINEINYFRGAAISLKLSNNFELSLFGSYNRLDGNIADKDTFEPESDIPRFSSINEDGYHRTELEINKENTIDAIATGTQIKWKNRRSSVGLNFLFTRFNKSFERNLELYNQFQFRGRSLANTSIDYSHRWKNMNTYGELAMSDNGAFAQVHGVLIGLNRKLDFAMLYRNYSKDYQSLNSNSFGETSGTNNENGLYMGFVLRPVKSWTIYGYADLWRHQWLRFRRDAPSTGEEYVVKLEYFKKRKFTFYLQYKFEQKQINNSGSFKIDPLQDIILQRIRIHFSHKVNQSIELRNRLEFSFHKNEKSSTSGFLLYQDLLYKPIASPLSLTARIAIFDTENFDTRIYAYENDLIYEYFIPFYQNRGIRYYLNLRYDIYRDITAEFRIAQSYFENRNTIGSGNDLINGKRRTEIKAQVRFKF